MQLTFALVVLESSGEHGEEEQKAARMAGTFSWCAVSSPYGVKPRPASGFRFDIRNSLSAYGDYCSEFGPEDALSLETRFTVTIRQARFAAYEFTLRRAPFLSASSGRITHDFKDSNLPTRDGIRTREPRLLRTL